MDINAFRNERSPILIATFLDGYTVGWRFAVPEAFKDALDIKSTPRQIGNRSVNVITQGKLFNFNQGSILYDTRLAYDLEWGEALKHIKLSLQIEEVKPSQCIVSETIEIESKDVKATVKGRSESSKPQEKTLDGLIIKKERMDYGLIKFKLYRPNKNKSAIEVVDTIECDQEEFVALLQTGTVRTKDNKIRDLFKEYSKEP
ncbi:MAG: hypothetical protein ABSC53_05230 [Bacteroidota bacterium]|jgi:hypothetical protein